MAKRSTKAVTINARERQFKALELRKAGVGFVEIGKQLGYKDHTGAFRAVQAALKATLREPADDVRKLELERLDRLTLALWTRSKAGDETAIDRVLKIMDRRARLLGLDAPTKIANAVTLEPFQWTDDIAEEAAAPPASGAEDGGEPSGEV